MRRQNKEYQKLKEEKLKYSTLRQNNLKYNKSILEIISIFSKQELPNWGGLIFNGKKLNQNG